ncbi:hypothetical protein TCAL_10465, partial [Tigriopus californicus]
MGHSDQPTSHCSELYCIVVAYGMYRMERKGNHEPPERNRKRGPWRKKNEERRKTRDEGGCSGTIVDHDDVFEKAYPCPLSQFGSLRRKKSVDPSSGWHIEQIITMKPFLILFVLLTIVHAKTAERHSNSKNRQRTQRTPSIEVNSATSGSSKTIGHSVDYDHFLEE